VAADEIDRTHVVLVAFFEDDTVVEINSERSTVKGVLDVVHCDRIACEQCINEALSNNLAKCG
jgi:hypothetical protein